ncbi:hypothetical protein WOLCODRAFT_143660 [Wolfiporia cocos MD-104 SS10]|uniref:Uncharacterized protein n=1 Tax=Wolfiporia cocos (strain MD-104) TaxID=742152 RepID=A0A2H3JHD6_WOLCO|nr:hypothetical protein WOLCODRAFT_143660 [Wolfiporia cocos MD-104 SS10]
MLFLLQAFTASLLALVSVFNAYQATYTRFEFPSLGGPFKYLQLSGSFVKPTVWLPSTEAHVHTNWEFDEEFLNPLRSPSMRRPTPASSLPASQGPTSEEPTSSAAHVCWASQLIAIVEQVAMSQATATPSHVDSETATMDEVVVSFSSDVPTSLEESISSPERVCWASQLFAVDHQLAMSKAVFLEQTVQHSATVVEDGVAVHFSWGMPLTTYNSPSASLLRTGVVPINPKRDQNITYTCSKFDDPKLLSSPSNLSSPSAPVVFARIISSTPNNWTAPSPVADPSLIGRLIDRVEGIRSYVESKSKFEIATFFILSGGVLLFLELCLLEVEIAAMSTDKPQLPLAPHKGKRGKKKKKRRRKGESSSPCTNGDDNSPSPARDKLDFSPDIALTSTPARRDNNPSHPSEGSTLVNDTPSPATENAPSSSARRSPAPRAARRR